MPATFNDEECYELFIAVDSRARSLKGKHEDVNALRDRLLPFYVAWHTDNPHMVHPSAIRAGSIRHPTPGAKE